MSLAGKTIAITGALSRTREEYIKLIESQGGEFASSVTKKVTHLVAASPDEHTTKLDKARAMGIMVVGESFLSGGGAAAGSQVVTPTVQVAAVPKVLKQQTLAPLAPLAPLAHTKGKLSGMTIALTGRMSKTKEEYGRIIAANGGTLATTVTKKTTHVVTAEPDGASDKLQKARKNGAQICGEDFILQLAGETTALPRDAIKNEGGAEGDDDGDTTGLTKMTSPPAVLLAETYDPVKHKLVGWWVSEKMDGVRSWWDGEKFWSRTGNLFRAPEWFCKLMPTGCTLDGELFIGRQKFRETVSIVKSHSESDRWHQIQFMVFDIPSEGARPFEERVEMVRRLCDGRKNLVPVEQRLVRSTDDIAKMLADVEALGGEGLMFRQPGSAYVGKRSKTLLKMKSFKDEEAEVIGYATEGKGRLAGTTGSLMVKDCNGITFKVGSGLDDATRANPPRVGDIITFRYQEKQDSGRPRFPVFVGIAIDKDFRRKQ